jgi:nucleoid DNA-binding protein
MIKPELVTALATQFPQFIARDVEWVVKALLNAMSTSLALGVGSRSVVLGALP